MFGFVSECVFVCMCVLVCVLVFISVFVYFCTLVNMYVRLCLYVCYCVYLCTFVSFCALVNMYVRLFVRVYVCMCMCTCMPIHARINPTPTQENIPQHFRTKLPSPATAEQNQSPLQAQRKMHKTNILDGDRTCSVPRAQVLFPDMQ